MGAPRPGPPPTTRRPLPLLSTRLPRWSSPSLPVASLGSANSAAVGLDSYATSAWTQPPCTAASPPSSPPACSAPTTSATSSSTPPPPPPCASAYTASTTAPLPRRPRAQARRPRIDAGVSSVEEVEEPLDPALTLVCVNNPARLCGVDSPITRLVSDEYGVGGDAVPFVCLGGFQNTRGVYELEEGEGLVLVLDGNVFPCCGIAERKTVGEMEQDFLKALQ